MYQLDNNRYVRCLDSCNWVIAAVVTPEKEDGEPYEKILAYYPNLKTAVNGAIEISAKETKDLKELKEVVKRFEDIINQLNKDA